MFSQALLDARCQVKMRTTLAAQGRNVAEGYNVAEGHYVAGGHFEPIFEPFMNGSKCNHNSAKQPGTAIGGRRPQCARWPCAVLRCHDMNESKTGTITTEPRGS